MDQLSDFVWWNGKLTPWADATIHASALGASSVGAVFEGIRGYADGDGETVRAFRLPDHLARLGQSMHLMRMPTPWSAAEIEQACRELVAANGLCGDLYLRPMAYFTPSYRPTFELGTDTELLITASAVDSFTPRPLAAGVSSYRRIQDDVMPPRVKNYSNYRNGQLAHTEVSLNGLDTAIMLNAAGLVTEGTAACVFLIRDGRVLTPDLASGILESLTRDTLITLLRTEMGLEVLERPVDRTELYLADEIFLAGTMAEVGPIGSVDHYRVGDGAIGPVTRAVHALYSSVVRGRVPGYHHWLTTI